MWSILFVACSLTACYPGEAVVSASSLEECKANGIEGLAVFEAYNPRLKVTRWTCRAPLGLRGALYE